MFFKLEMQLKNSFNKQKLGLQLTKQNIIFCQQQQQLNNNDNNDKFKKKYLILTDN